MALFFYWLVRVPKKSKKAQIQGGEVAAPAAASCEKEKQRREGEKVGDVENKSRA